MKYVYASLVVIVCVLIVLNIDKLKTKKPQNKDIGVYYNCQEVNLDTNTDQFNNLQQTVFGSFGVIGTVVNYLNYGVDLLRQTGGKPTPPLCGDIEHNIYIDKRTDFNYEKITVSIIGVLLILFIFKK